MEKAAKGSGKIGRLSFIIIFTVFLTAITIFTSSQPIYGNIPINIIIPIYLLTKLDAVFFEKLKLSTLVVMRILILFVVFGLLDGQTFVRINLIFLAINIMEATLTDLRKKKYYNAVVGFFLAATIIFIEGQWLDPFYRASSPGNLSMLAWILVYTVWNWIFVTNEFSPAIALYHIAILATPILGVIIFRDPGMWLMFRAYSLTTGGNIQIAKKQYLETRLKSSKFADFVEKTGEKRVQLFLMLVNLALLGLMIYISVK